MHSQGAGKSLRTAWSSMLVEDAATILLFELLSGLAIGFGPFHPVVEWGLLPHTIIGVLTLAPLAWYLLRHWRTTGTKRSRMFCCWATSAWAHSRSASSRA